MIRSRQSKQYVCFIIIHRPIILVHYLRLPTWTALTAYGTLYVNPDCIRALVSKNHDSLEYIVGNQFRETGKNWYLTRVVPEHLVVKRLRKENRGNRVDVWRAEKPTTSRILNKHSQSFWLES
ncbi:hypothetical protein PHYBLDRAFT_65652 [Phycomyces blakesleeanus NRRL 1555(-)]|uniref:Uncharacterized protein n=1 Tax=Phycomyces blakesleeanus (strain ATCC 8743b / DSM 1359 / FGSC 10004 / NBRC 33097 / NRRL 1555) TaxID=763407 RepID=A0A162TZN9_PHYB8|nr:hypothetical protein PHYBLDRAFT_65652 [Phycomyces blakesleeanus NRRL 1555(-)]OAD72302.1 hypothetical protein PHYBLDRAFT_65652 [Phycomyces blakesleeanus NRRL 1555(-)]|eukprot:XP_018290342.1 hypothetical protein PHYBLDRAFT_65652 [Phycomyces blakesleeanus NRRL 1555(-)]